MIYSMAKGQPVSALPLRAAIRGQDVHSRPQYTKVLMATFHTKPSEVGAEFWAVSATWRVLGPSC
jgi:hypothetical protein